MSSLWERRRAYAEASKKPWRILSAQHGVIDPDELIAPYDVALKDLSAGERRAWARRTAPQVLEVLIETGAETVEIHAGAAYTESGLRQTLEALGYRVIIPLAHHRIGEQLAWYQRRPDPLTASEPHTLRVPTADHASRLAADYRSKAFGGGWGGLPEAIGADRLRSEGVNEVGIRRWITFVAAMDRARDATRLWESSVAAFPSDAWIYDPPKVIGRPHHDLQTTLKRLSISQRHGPDCDAWRIIAETLTDPACPGTVIAALHGRPVKAADLLEALQRKRLDGAPRFPLLKGPKIGPLWVRMLVFPGGAQVSGLETIPVAVDTHVQRASEMLGLVFTRELSDGHRRNIQQVWFDAVGKTGSFGGPEAIDGTAAGLDPALWALGREGCSRCEQARVMKPIGSICDLCVLGRVG